MPFGYTGQNLPNQTKANSGVFSISEVADLEKQGKFGGSLELIEEKSISGVTVADFTNIKGTIYDVHFLTVNDVEVATDDDRLHLRFSNDGGSTFETTNYQRANQQGESDGTFFESRTTTGSGLITTCLAGNATNEKSNADIYLYNLSNSLKYSLQTWQSNSIRGNGTLERRFGGGVYAVAETINAIRLYSNAGTNFSCTAKLYGVKQL